MKAAIALLGAAFGILWLDVQESEMLRYLHNRINLDLLHQFNDTHADHDGQLYHFHDSMYGRSAF
jgi:hypothetical protein